MSNKRIVAVTGATGAQGGSVVKFLANDATFAVRAITRDPDSAKAKELKSKYPEIEIVKATLDDVDSLKKALDGAYGVFGVTNFWEAGEQRETVQGKNLVDAAKATGVKHFVWSTLDKSGDPLVPHWISKWRVDEYLKESGVPRTSLYTGAFIENFLRPNVAPKEIGKDTYLLSMPILADSPIFWFPSYDTGAWVLAALKDPDTWIGKDMPLVSEWLSMRQLAEIASKVTGKRVVPLELTEEQFEQTRNASYPGAEELYLNLKFFVDHGPETGIRDKELTWKLYPQTTTWEQHVKEYQKTLFP